MRTHALTLSGKSIQADDEGTTYSFSSTTDVALSHHDESHETDDETRAHSINGPQVESNGNGRATPTADVALSHYVKSCEADDETQAYSVNETRGESYGSERATFAGLETCEEQISKDQSEETECNKVLGALCPGSEEVPIVVGTDCKSSFERSSAIDSLLEEAKVLLGTDCKSLKERSSGEPLEQSTLHHVDVENDPEMEEQKSTTPIVNKTSMEDILKTQTEQTKENLVHVAQHKSLDQSVRDFAAVLADIVCLWQHLAQGKDPTSYQIDFGVGQPLTLLMVLALLPEVYQYFISIEDAHRSPFQDGGNLSWLHEQTMDVLAGLGTDPVSTSRIFGPGLASMVRDDLDESWKKITGRSWLEDQIHLMSKDELELDLYRFPPESKKIVFFFNPTEVHWTVVEINLDDEVWTYTLYNSLCQGPKGPTWRACQEQLPLLEQLICRASGFAEPKTREIVVGASAQQDNPYDCGPIAIHNAQELLEGITPRVDVHTESIRLSSLYLIHDALLLLKEGLEVPEFRARMRETYLAEYLDYD